jgi:iron complex outermembrane recepter protein
MRTFAYSCGVALAALTAIPAAAQQAEPASPVPAAPFNEEDVAAAADQAGDIVVTGTRRASRLQDVPVSITALSGEALANSGYKTATDLQYIAPGVSFNPQLGAGFTIRGLGTQGFDYNLERAVGVVVDDVVQALPRTIGFTTLADVERIEVLKGPQGTLFGKNVSAGAIYVVTQRPTFTGVSAEGSARYGERNEVRFDNSVNLPLADNLAVRLTGVYQSQDGYLRNEFTGQHGGGYRDYNLRGKLLWQATPELEVYLIGALQDHRDDGLGGLGTVRVLGPYTAPVSPTSSTLIDFPALLAQYGIVPGSENLSYAHNARDEVFIRQKDAQAQLTYDLGGGFALKSITAYTSAHVGSQFDQDQVQTNFYDLNDADQHAHQFSQELRISSPRGGMLDYVAGLYFFDSKTDAVERSGGVRNMTLPPNTLSAALVAAAARYVSRSRSVAAFGEANLHLTDRLTVIGGLRYTNDRVSSRYAPTTDNQYTFVGNVPVPVSAVRRADNLSGKITVQYKPSTDTMFYSTYSRGYKAPAVGTSIGSLRPVEQETVDNFEIGARTQFLDRRLTVNASFFYERFNNFQTTVSQVGADGITRSVLANAPHVLSRGVEAEISARPVQGVTLGGNVSWAPTEYQDFLAPCYSGQPRLTAPGQGCYALGSGFVNNVDGLPSIQAPETTFNLFAGIERPVNERIQAFANFNYYHRSSAYSVAGNPNTIIPAYGLLNGTIGVGAADGRVRLSVYGRNILDKVFASRIQTITFAPAGSYLQYVSGEGRRTVGVRLDYRF